MTTDHLSAVANQKNGPAILLRMVADGRLTADRAVRIMDRQETNLATRLAYLFSWTMFYLAEERNR